VCIGSLIERKNVVALADAFATLGSGSLAFVGDGPLRGALEGRERVRVIGRIPQSEVPAWIAAADVVCQPSLREPFGQATLEGLAMERSVVATTAGGPPEFVTADAGVLVDPLDHDALAAALRQAAAMPTPNPQARAAAAAHDVRVQVGRMAEVLAAAAASR
jgi:glycosyltransferase involved in cell wall biosynthesis